MKKSKKCAIILPYFGKFNSYYPMFLKSCGTNRSFDWLVFTDDEIEYPYPENVHVIPYTLRQLKEVAERKLDMNVSLEMPYKLCDYKPLYGFLFEEYLKEYEYWGHCDCDLVFGNLEKMLLPLLDKGYDKIFAVGHLTLYKNTAEICRRFMNKYNGVEIYRDALGNEKIYVFDEDYMKERNNVHSIFLESDASVFAEDLSLNVTLFKAHFIRSAYNPVTRKFVRETYTPRRYFWTDGRLVSAEWDANNKRVILKDFLYMHLQGRKMRVKCDFGMEDCVEILPDRFVAAKALPTSKSDMKLYSIHRTYLFWWDYYFRKIQRKWKKLFNH